MTDTQAIYLDRDQCARFSVPYHPNDGVRLDVGADTLLSSKGLGYDPENTAFLTALGSKTLCLVGRGRGWFNVEQVL